ncbi:hypothetical protein [Sporosarcina sp. USHLN248]|uniref:hypothetical protein n=1 Tax=Sporosarcina sp. USHLN248 TaxID=3081300 RepID=UPI003017C0BB
MYDPTIFENLKVAFENHIYDLDTIERKITILDRKDRMDFAVLSRDFALQFALVDQTDVRAAVMLKASANDLAGEILEWEDKNIGCALSLQFMMETREAMEHCSQIEQSLLSIWENDVRIVQTFSFTLPQETTVYQHTIDVMFKRKINEEHIGDIRDFLDHVLVTLKLLNSI